jgi:integrase
MTQIDREKFMDQREVEQLRRVTEAHAITDLEAGRCQGVLAWAVVDIALQTGLRVSELARLKVGDFDPRRLALKVWRHKRRRQVHETTAISRDLGRHLKAFIRWLHDTGRGTAPEGPLFVGKRGGLTARGLQQIWKGAVKRAGLPAEISIHAARHTLAVHLLKKTGNLRMVQKALGHTNPTITANLYANISFEDMQSGVDGLYQRDQERRAEGA